MRDAALFVVAAGGIAFVVQSGIWANASCRRAGFLFPSSGDIVAFHAVVVFLTLAFVLSAYFVIVV